MRRRTIFGLIFVSAAVIVGLFSSAHKHIFATENQNLWLSDLNLQVGRDATTEDTKTFRDCYNFPVQFPSYTNTQNSPSNNPRLITVNNCEVAGIGDYIRAGYGYKQKGYQRVHGIPGSDWTLVSYAKDSGRAFAVAQQPSMIGKFTAANANNPLEGTFEVTDPGLPYIKNDLGQVVAFNPNSYNFSQNGRYIIAEALYAGLVRIDVETMKVTLFSNQTYTYGMGFDPTPVMAISNDGNTAIVSNFEGGPLQLYDLQGCTANQIKAYNNAATGCKQPKDIRTFLKQQFPNYWRLYGIQFEANNQSLRAVAAEKNPATGLLSRKVITINQAGYAPEPVDYIAMGDSFASGEGDMDDNWYAEGTNVHGLNMCHLSKRSYPYLLNSTISLDNFHSIACSGAKTKDILADIQYDEEGRTGIFPGYKPQKNQLTPSPSFITLSVGGNDLGFSDILTDCVLPANDGSCKYVRNAKDRGDTAKRIAKLHETLTTTYKEIKKTTNRETKIYVVGYPQFINPEGTSCGNNVNLDTAEREYINKSVTYTNKVIKSAAQAAGVYYLDIENVLNSTNLCSGVADSESTVNGLTLGDDKPDLQIRISGWEGGLGLLGNESYHPNQNGHQLIKDRILQLTSGDPAGFQTCETSKPVCDESAQKIPLPDASYYGAEAYTYVQRKNGDSTAQTAEPSDVTKAISVKNISGRLVNIGSKTLTFSPLGRVTVWLHSTPVQIGETVATTDGSISPQITLPENVTPGLHELHFKGKNLAGEEVDYYLPIFIPALTGDTNSNGIADNQETCGLIPSSGVDYDQDGVDDACDGQIGEPPVIPEEATPPADPNAPQDAKTPLGESVAGLEVLLNPEMPTATSQTTSLVVAPQQSTQSVTTNNSAQNNQPVLGETAAVSTSPIHQKAEASLAASPKISSAKATYILFILIALSIFGLARYSFAKAKD